MFSLHPANSNPPHSQPRQPVTRRICWERAPEGRQIVVRDAATQEVIAVLDSLFDLAILGYEGPSTDASPA